MAVFERNYEQIANTELWQLLVKRSEEQGLGREFVTAVGKVCAIGLDLSKDIIRFFPNFTCHDGSHSAHVCDWMARLLGERTKDLTAHEAALLVMAACCHDIGMSVSDDQRKKLRNPAFSGWRDYFAAHLDDDEVFCRTQTISEGMLRNYVRLHHHERIRENLRSSDWPRELSLSGLPWEALLVLCKSHGTSLSRSELKNTANYDLLLCAVLLRLADLLDYDASRTSDALFRHMGLDAPQTAEEALSAQEHQKNRVGAFDPNIRDGIIRYRAVYDHPQVEHDIREYLDWIEGELDHCAESLTRADKRWQDLPLPYKISTEEARRNGYAAGKFCMTMDQDRVIELLAGKNLYSDPGVFVRELLQNSIDAVLMRTKQDPDFSLEDGRIIIDTWPGDAGDTWFRIRDNGTGMDEHIIQNYFLKVGRSYYTSDEFRAANRHAPGGKSYTAISRFGIGILSCFMTDPEGTELKVSTKRFRGSGDNGIRLDVTGLHGYYYLSHEAQHPDYEDSFLQMPSPDGEDLGYREEPGTTICVRTNLFRMGGLQSFREILDKYVQFPEIRVEYNGPEGHKEYPTQQELMDAVHALNPDGEVREYVHEIPDEWFERIKDILPIIKWKERPSVVLRYHPINWLSDTDNMTGAIITIHLKHDAFFVEGMLKKKYSLNERQVLHENFTLSYNGETEIYLQFSLDGFHPEDYLEPNSNLRRMGRGVSFHLSVAGSNSILSEQEQIVMDFVRNSLNSVKSRNSYIAYNGILAATNAPLTGHTCYCNSLRSVILLRDTFLPEVDLARNTITRLPVEVACCLTLGLKQILMAHITDGPNIDCYELLTERELWEILQRHPKWENMLLEDNAASISGLPHNLYDYLLLATWKRTNAVIHGYQQGTHIPLTYRVEHVPGDDQTADFPIGMFYWFEVGNNSLAKYSWSRIVYNRDHVFSQWLIQNRAILSQKVPATYDILIRTMILNGSKRMICDKINSILTHLRNYEQNRFQIHDDLFLSESDFVSTLYPY